MLDDPRLTAGEAGLRAGYKSVGMGPTMRVEHFNAEGLSGLMAALAASGGRPTRRRSRVRRSAWRYRSRGRWDIPELWALARLQKAFEERHGVYWSDSTLWT